MFGALDVLDHFSTIERHGVANFAALLGDALHVVAGIEATYLSILDVRPLVEHLRRAPRYKILFEIDFVGCNMLPAGEIHRIYERITSLHSEVTRRRWSQLALLQKYSLGACPEIQMSEAVSKEIQDGAPGRCGEGRFAKVVAHMDLLDKNPKKPQHALSSWTSHLKHMVVKAICTVCNLNEDLITVTCIKLRGAHKQNAARLQKVCEVLLEDEISKDDEDDRFVDLGDLPTGDNASAGYTVEFEIYNPNKALYVDEDLQHLARGLRKLHSEAVRREFEELDLFKKFIFDVGLIMEQDNGCTDSQPLEQQILAVSGNNRAVGPTLLAGNSSTSEINGKEQILLSGHLNIFEKKSTKEDQHQIREWFLQALKLHLQDRCDVVVAMRMKSDDEDENSGLNVLHLRPHGYRSSKPFFWDGLLFVVTGIRKKASHQKVIRKGSLKLDSAEEGVNAATISDNVKAYRIDFEVWQIADSKDTLSEFANHVRELLHDMISQRTDVGKHVAKRGESFYRYYEFDRGIQIDSIDRTLREENGKATPFIVEHSMSPLWIRATMRFSAKQATGQVAQNLALERLRSTFCGKVAIPLGVEASQIEVDMETGFEGNFNASGCTAMCQVNFRIRTLTHAPALAEVAGIRSKIAAMDDQSALGHRGWRESFGEWLPCSISATEEQPKDAVAETYTYCLAFSIEFGRAAEDAVPGMSKVNSNFVSACKREELHAIIAEQLGFSRHRLVMVGIKAPEQCNGTLAEFQILGLRNEIEAQALKAFLLEHKVEPRQATSRRDSISTPVQLLPSSWGPHKVLNVEVQQMGERHVPPQRHSETEYVFHGRRSKERSTHNDSEAQAAAFQEMTLEELMRLYKKEWETNHSIGLSGWDPHHHTFLDGCPLAVCILKCGYKKLRGVSFDEVRDADASSSREFLWRRREELAMPGSVLKDFAWALTQAVQFHANRATESRENRASYLVEGIRNKDWHQEELRFALRSLVFLMCWKDRDEERQPNLVRVYLKGTGLSDTLMDVALRSANEIIQHFRRTNPESQACSDTSQDRPFELLRLLHSILAAFDEAISLQDINWESLSLEVRTQRLRIMSNGCGISIMDIVCKRLASIFTTQTWDLREVGGLNVTLLVAVRMVKHAWLLRDHARDREIAESVASAVSILHRLLEVQAEAEHNGTVGEAATRKAVSAIVCDSHGLVNSALRDYIVKTCREGPRRSEVWDLLRKFDDLFDWLSG
eukprot:TRINITY_DN14901_c0_g1_i2.p1 TRINITY_DN14901_c0_g1~~TRINITY_DN14901_c0_g1_i2.p1  ORF type:complete len:1229 (-),score=227.41 TRINITY_DN14901_c0_g1_i2:126-3812(-)